MKGRIVVVAAVVIRGGYLLVSQRGAESGYAGYWEFPGGKREPGESDVAALRRELREELAVEVAVGPLVWTATAGPLLLRFHRCAYLPGNRPRPLACAQFRWVRLGDLDRYAFPPADDGLVAEIGAGRIA